MASITSSPPRANSVSPPLAPMPPPSGATVSPTLGPASHWAQQTSTGTFRPPPPLSLADGSEQQRSAERGRPNSKYKTELCRNWENTGCCTYRGCTFAHGHEELRMSHQTPPLGPQPSSAGGKPGHLHLERLYEMLGGEIRHERDVLCQQQEVNRALEQTLQAEQQRRREQIGNIEDLEAQVAILTNAIIEEGGEPVPPTWA